MPAGILEINVQESGLYLQVILAGHTNSVVLKRPFCMKDKIFKEMCNVAVIKDMSVI